MFCLWHLGYRIHHHPLPLTQIHFRQSKFVSPSQQQYKNKAICFGNFFYSNITSFYKIYNKRRSEDKVEEEQEECTMMFHSHSTSALNSMTHNVHMSGLIIITGALPHNTSMKEIWHHFQLPGFSQWLHHIGETVSCRYNDASILLGILIPEVFPCIF